MSGPLTSSTLAGIRVVAVEQAVAGPLCTRHLAELGADVVKVERPRGGDPARRYDGYVGGHASHFVWLNHGKRSVALDLKSPGGRQALVDLLARADVLVSNLGPGALDRIVDDETITALNPRLIRCSISGYGGSGPYRDRKAYDLLVQGEAGVTLNTGTTGNPAKPGVSIADLAAGTYAFASVTAALARRAVTGEGARLEIAMFDTVAEWMMPLLLAHREGGVDLPPSGAAHAGITPYGPYRTADRAMVNIAVHTDGQWRALCEHVLEDPGLAADPRWATNARRLEHRAAVEERVARSVGLLGQDELARRLDVADVPWGRLNDVGGVARHPQLRDRDRWQPVTLPGGASVDVLTSPFLDDAADAGSRRLPELGEHTAEVLRELGYAEAVVEGLVEAAAVGRTP